MRVLLGLLLVRFDSLLGSSLLRLSSLSSTRPHCVTGLSTIDSQDIEALVRPSIRRRILAAQEYWPFCHFMYTITLSILVLPSLYSPEYDMQCIIDSFNPDSLCSPAAVSSLTIIIPSQSLTFFTAIDALQCRANAMRRAHFDC